MRRYRTEIVIPPDRHIGLQLPQHLPEGRAIVIIQVEESDEADAAYSPDSDPDQQDIEWWGEFEDAEVEDSFESRLR